MYKLKSKIYVKNSAKEPGKAVEIRENHKIEIYENLSDHYYFEPVCVLKLYVHGVHVISRGLNLIKIIGILKDLQKVRFWN